jgi:hypothetical protein
MSCLNCGKESPNDLCLECEGLLSADPDEPEADVQVQAPEEPELLFDGDLAGLLDDIARAYRRFVIVDDHGVVVLALWVAHTYVYDLFRVTPYLHITSTDPGCGKTTVGEVSQPLARRGRLSTVSRARSCSG